MEPDCDGVNIWLYPTSCCIAVCTKRNACPRLPFPAALEEAAQIITSTPKRPKYNNAVKKRKLLVEVQEESTFFYGEGN